MRIPVVHARWEAPSLFGWYFEFDRSKDDLGRCFAGMVTKFDLGLAGFCNCDKLLEWLVHSFETFHIIHKLHCTGRVSLAFPLLSPAFWAPFYFFWSRLGHG